MGENMIAMFHQVQSRVSNLLRMPPSDGLDNNRMTLISITEESICQVQNRSINILKLNEAVRENVYTYFSILI